MEVFKKEIDFIEYCFLVEACIPPRPIARSMFWKKVIDKDFYQMSKTETKRLYEWIIKNPNFDNNDVNCRLFDLRFNPDNQYKVKTNYNGEKEIHLAYLCLGKYYITSTTSLIAEYITKIEKL